MSKKKYVSPAKELQNECERLWKEIIRLRDGEVCVVKIKYPEIHLHHSDVFQADHCFTRANKHLFLEIANGTMVCSSCNRAKHYDNKSVKRAVDYIVQEREGMARWEEMLAIDMGMSANENWHKVWWLEEQRDRLLIELNKLKLKEGEDAKRNKGRESLYRNGKRGNGQGEGSKDSPGANGTIAGNGEEAEKEIGEDGDARKQLRFL